MAHYPVLTEPLTDLAAAQDSDAVKTGDQLELFTPAELIKL